MPLCQNHETLKKMGVREADSSPRYKIMKFRTKIVIIWKQHQPAELRRESKLEDFGDLYRASDKSQ